jgi:nucleoside-diphosphate-sugar epimerase
MPTVQPPAKVLVSGATGYIAVWVVQNLLDRGYAVRGTARSVAKGDFLKKVFASYASGDRFEVVIVVDIAEDGAFDEAVKGVDAIEHTASPFHLNAVDPDELIKPAVNGTVGILKSILKDGSTRVRRVVITSSGAAILREDPNPITFTEADWNNQCLEILKKYEDEGRKDEAPNVVKYRASKTLAERSAWEFVNSPENKSRINWDLVVLNPPLVFGPAIHEVTTPASLNTSAATFYNYVVDGAKANATGNDFLANTGTCWIDVRDLAEAHALALEKEAAGGERILVSAGLWKWQDFIDAANDLSPPPRLSTTLPVGVRGAGKTAKHLMIYDTAKANRILGLKYRTIEETTRDTLADYEARGW